MKALVVTLLLALAWAPSIQAAEATPRSALLVLTKGDTSLSIFDPVSLRLVAKLNVGADPHEVEATADGRLAFVTNYANGRTLAVVDLVEQKVLPPVDLGSLRAPHGLAIADGKVYFTAENSRIIGRVDPATRTVDWSLGLGELRTHMILVTPDARRIFTTNMDSNSVTLLELPAPAAAGARGGRGATANWTTTNIAVGAGPEGFDLTPDGRELWVGNSREPTISVIDVARKAVTATLAIPANRANRLKFSPDGKLAVVSGLGGEIVVIDAVARKELKRFPVGSGAAGILMQPDGSRAYISVGSESRVRILDLKTLELTGAIPTGPTPDGLAWAVRTD